MKLSKIMLVILALCVVSVLSIGGTSPGSSGRCPDSSRGCRDSSKGCPQKALDEAKNTSPEITAPFAGFITKVNVKGGDGVRKGTVAVQLADPNKFEADILVNEMDIFNVKLGQNATVQVDAMPTLNLSANVTHISPTATIQQGVVNFKVTVEIEPLQSVMQEQLREGMTVTVSVIVEQKSNVLLVPNAAIATKGGQTYVQVLIPGGTIEERSITVGISNGQYTEVTNGLSEGEKVIVPKVTTTTPTTQQGEQTPFFGPPPR